MASKIPGIFSVFEKIPILNAQHRADENECDSAITPTIVPAFIPRFGL